MDKCCREVLERSVIEKFWSSSHRQEMPTNAPLFEYEPFRHFCMSIARSSYLVYNLRLSQTITKNRRKYRRKRTVVSL